jgi:hypothetical protein
VGTREGAVKGINAIEAAGVIELEEPNGPTVIGITEGQRVSTYRIVTVSQGCLYE